MSKPNKNDAGNLINTVIMFILASLLLAGVSAESPGDMRQKYDIRSQQMSQVASKKETSTTLDMTLENPYSWRAHRLAPNTASQLKGHSSGPSVTVEKVGGGVRKCHVDHRRGEERG